MGVSGAVLVGCVLHERVTGGMIMGAGRGAVTGGAVTMGAAAGGAAAVVPGMRKVDLFVWQDGQYSF